jgi:hypothetical protein
MSRFFSFGKYFACEPDFSFLFSVLLFQKCDFVLMYMSGSRATPIRHKISNSLSRILSQLKPKNVSRNRTKELHQGTVSKKGVKTRVHATGMRDVLTDVGRRKTHDLEEVCQKSANMR